VKFPREVWAGANIQTNTFSNKRKLVHNQNEFNSYVKMYNGKMNCFTSVYDYASYTEKQAITSTVILDRIFLDFDAHQGSPNKLTGSINISPNKIRPCFEDLKQICNYLAEVDSMFDISFSGRGFHVYVYGEATNNIRQLTAFFNNMKKLTSNGTLDSSAVSSRRLRRVRNTMNMKASHGDGCYYCIPLTLDDVRNLDIDSILEMAKTPNPIPLSIHGTKLVSWPEVAPIEESTVEVDVINVGNLPMPPCMHSAIMIENPTDEARAFLVSWYKDLLLWADFNTPFTTAKANPDLETRQRITEQITQEIKHLHEKYNVWLDFDESTTRYRTRYVVDGNYSFPNCYTLIPKGYCIGKCWRLK
tara:strand:- start:2837 stop:3916 length:1080 start_codon:yes stop_codon:yes gene_type:complete